MMDNYETAYEKLKDVDSKREKVDLDDFEEFMKKVEEVNKMVHALTSNNKSEVEEASNNAAIWLKTHKKEKSNDKELIEEVIHQPYQISKIQKKTYNKTVINEKQKEVDNTNCETMSQEDFMKYVEEDAKKRSEDRQQRKIESDALKENAKKAFLSRDYEKALVWYNKAIDVRKDCHTLYTNRALTLLHLGLFTRALNDCETALKLNEGSFKAVAYKGKALFLMGEEEKAEEWMNEAKKICPDRIAELEEYQKSWISSCQDDSD